jgi:hypothetical protein
MKYTILLFFLLIPGLPKNLPAAETPAGLKLYVSVEGNDKHSGRAPGQAFQTLERARDELRALKKEKATGPRVVEILPGTYSLSESLALTAEDSGTAESPVIYRAREAGTVKLTGARALKIADFKSVTDPVLLERLDPSARGKVLALDVRATGLSHAGPFPNRFDDQGGLFEVFSNGKRLPLSRWPNDGATTTMKRVLTVGDQSVPGVFEYREDRPARWTQNTGVWLKGQWRVGWEDPALRVAKIDPESRTITFAVGLSNGIGNKYTRPNGNGAEPWCAINLLEEIDRAGEWAVDFDAGILYLWPPQADPGAEIVISQLEKPLITVSDAAHLSFTGITFELSLGDGVVMENVTDCLVAGCTVRQLGGRGVVIHGTKSGVRSCDIYELGQGGIYISGGDRKTLARSENFVLNNHLHHYGVLKGQYSAGVHVGALGNPSGANAVRDAVGIRIAHNVLHHAPRDAFLYSGNDNLYEYNEVYYCGYDTADVGAFYSWLDWTMRGNVIRYNFMHDTVGGVNPDDGASGNFVFGNIFAGPRTGVWIASGPDNTIQNNIFIKESGSVFGMDDRGTGRKYATNPRLINRVKEINPDQEPWASAHPELKGMLDNKPELPWRTKFIQNLIVSQKPAPSELKMKAELKTNPDILLEKDNFTTAEDPGFVDLAGKNFQLKPDSAVFQKIPGFQPIPFDKMGLHIDEFRLRLPTEEEHQRAPKDSPYKQPKETNYGT